MVVLLVADGPRVLQVRQAQRLQLRYSNSNRNANCYSNLDSQRNTNNYSHRPLLRNSQRYSQPRLRIHRRRRRDRHLYRD